MLGKRQLLLSVSMLFLAVSAHAQKVAVGYDHAVDFSKLKTYYWTKGVPAKNPEIDKRITAMIDEQMSLKGLTRTTDSGDIALSYHATVMNTFESATVARPGTWGPRAGSMEAAWLVVKGALIIEMKDSTNNSELWRATATDTISNEPIKDPAKDLDKATKKLKKVIDKIFKYYPPGKPS